MTDEVGQHFRISITVWMIGALIAVVVGVSLFSFNIFNRYTGKYSDAMVGATTSSIYQLARQSSVTCPAVYASVTASIAEIDEVVFIKENGSVEVIYDFMQSDSDKLISLMTGGNVNKNVRVEITQSFNSPNMIVVKLTEVVK